MNPTVQYLLKTLKKDFFTGIALLLFSGVFFSGLVVADDLHDPTRTGKIFFFVRWMLLVIPVGLIVFIRNWKQPVDLLSVLFLLWAAWIMLRSKQGGIWRDEKFTKEGMREIANSAIAENNTCIKTKKGKNYAKSCTTAIEHQFW